MEKRRLEDLDLLDDFLFGTMLSYPEIGEKFIRELLKIIFGREFGTLTIIPQKVYPGSDTDLHGARLDVYIEENVSEESENDATVFDMEPDKNVRDVKDLPKRVRFYHAKIDAKSLKSGESYRKLKKVIVIMMTPYDPFGMNHMIYTIRNKCEELPDMPYDDGARTVFLYTKGTEGNPPEKVKQLLRYLEHTTEENAVTENLRRIHEMVKLVKQDEEVSLQYMKIFEREEMLIQQGRLEEQANTERERLRADQEKTRADQLEKELKLLKEKIRE